MTAAPASAHRLDKATAYWLTDYVADIDWCYDCSYGIPRCIRVGHHRVDCVVAEDLAYVTAVVLRGRRFLVDGYRVELRDYYTKANTIQSEPSDWTPRRLDAALHGLNFTRPPGRAPRTPRGAVKLWRLLAKQ